MLAFEENLLEIQQKAKACFASIQAEVEEQLDWLNSVCDGVKNGSINFQSVLLPKTPGKRNFSMAPDKQSLDETIDLEEEPTTRSTRSSRSQNKAMPSRKGSKKTTRKGAKKALRHSVVVEIEEVEEEAHLPGTESNKRPSAEAVASLPKRVCVSGVSRDSGVSSTESRGTGHSSMDGLIKQEVLSPCEKSIERFSQEGTTNQRAVSHKAYTDVTSKSDVAGKNTISNDRLSSTNRKRSRSAGRGTYVLEEIKKSARSCSESRGSDCQLDNITSENSHSNIQCFSPLKLNTILKSPAYKKSPYLRLVKLDSVKKAVKAFEKLNEEKSAEQSEAIMLPPSSRLPKAPPLSEASSLDDAVNAPPRLTRTKTRAMAKAAAEEEATSHHSQNATMPSKTAKSPVLAKVLKNTEKPLPSSFDKEGTALTSSRLLLKPFGSASKPNMFFKPSTPLSRSHLLTPNHTSGSSFSVPRLNNLVTSMESFISKPAIPEVRPTREDNLQKIVAKTEEASKKKEEIMKAQAEERMKKREEKRMKVCATREALEREKQELQQRLEREREEKQRQIQAEREEKLRQEALKKKRLAQQKAAETEERRRQEEAARLAKLKQQEEEQKRIAAQKKKEQEEAERVKLEREAAALRAKEAERLAKEIKAKALLKPQLDRTYDMLPTASQSYGLTPAPEDRKPLQPKNPDNYSIDDVCTDDSSEDESKPKKVVPMWAQPKQRMPKLMIQCEVTHQQMSIFFGSRKSTPDLSKIFREIDRRHLIRKSSAVWPTPPKNFSRGYCA